MLRFGKSIWSSSVGSSQRVYRKVCSERQLSAASSIVYQASSSYSSIPKHPIAKMNHYVIPVCNPNHFQSVYYSTGPSKTTTSGHQSSNDPLLSPRSTERPSPEDEKPPTTITGKMKAFFKKYGKLGFFVYFSISAISLSSIYFTLRSGVDVKALLLKVGFPEGKLFDGAGTLAVTYAIYKILLPLRLFLTVALTSWIAKRTRWGIPPSIRGSGEHKR